MSLALGPEVSAVRLDVRHPNYLLDPAPIVRAPSGRDISLTLERTGGIDVRIDFAVEPGVSLRALLLPYDRGTRFEAVIKGDLRSVGETRSCHFLRVSPGRYRVVLESSAAEPDGSVREQVVSVHAGETALVEFSSAPESGVLIEGRVLGLGVDGFQVIAGSVSSARVREGGQDTCDAQGRFSFALREPGGYVFEVLAKSALVSRTVLDVPPVDVFSVQLSLPEATLDGTVRGPGGGGLAGIEVFLQSTLSLEGSPGQQLFSSALTDSDGHFRMGHLTPGLYVLRAGGGDEFRQGPGWNKYGEWVREVSVADWDHVEIRLSEPHRLHGLVRGPAGSPLANAAIMIRGVPLSGAAWSWVASTNEAGEFEAPFVEAGDYWVLAAKHGPPERPMASVVARVSISEGGREPELSLSVLDATWVHVRAASPTGEVLPVRVALYDELGRELPLQGAHGELRYRQRLGPVPPGDYDVLGRLENGEVLQGHVSITGGLSDVQVDLHP